MKLVVIALVVLSVAVGAIASLGVDVSETTTTAGFQCLKKTYSFAVVRCSRSTGHVDPACPGTIANANAAGLSPSDIDIYIFPCSNCSASGQISNLTAYLVQNKVKYSGKLWLDIEQPAYWSKNQTANQKFFEELVGSAKNDKYFIGVYTSASQWNPIMNENYHNGASFPLWYAHYDNDPSFKDFKPFGGWKSPLMKQFNDSVNICGVSADANFQDNSTTTSTSSSTTGKTTQSATVTTTTGKTTDNTGTTYTGMSIWPGEAGGRNGGGQGWSNEGDVVKRPGGKPWVGGMPLTAQKGVVTEGTTPNNKKVPAMIAEARASALRLKRDRVVEVEDGAQPDIQVWEERPSKKF